MVTLRNTVPSPLRIGLDMIAIEQGAPLDMDLRVESVSEGVLVTGTVSGPTVGECSRCLTAVNGHVQVGLTELFAYPASTTEATTEEDEVGRVVDDRIDLEQAIIDAVGLDLPFAPVCRPDCQDYARDAVCHWPTIPATTMTTSIRDGPSWWTCSPTIPPTPTPREVNGDLAANSARRARG